jgi:hypothetical protein
VISDEWRGKWGRVLEFFGLPVDIGLAGSSNSYKYTPNTRSAMKKQFGNFAFSLLITTFFTTALFSQSVLFYKNTQNQKSHIFTPHFS